MSAGQASAVGDSAPLLSFSVRPSARLHWAGWEDEYVVFDETSGQTHQLDALRAYVLNMLIECPRTKLELMDELSVALGANPLSDLKVALDAVIDDFARHGLIEFIDS